MTPNNVDKALVCQAIAEALKARCKPDHDRVMRADARVAAVMRAVGIAKIELLKLASPTPSTPLKLEVQRPPPVASPPAGA